MLLPPKPQPQEFVVAVLQPQLLAVKSLILFFLQRIDYGLYYVSRHVNVSPFFEKILKIFAQYVGIRLA